MTSPSWQSIWCLSLAQWHWQRLSLSHRSKLERPEFGPGLTRELRPGDSGSEVWLMCAFVCSVCASDQFKRIGNWQTRTWRAQFERQQSLILSDPGFVARRADLLTPIYCPIHEGKNLVDLRRGIDIRKIHRLSGNQRKGAIQRHWARNAY